MEIDRATQVQEKKKKEIITIPNPLEFNTQKSIHGRPQKLSEFREKLSKQRALLIEDKKLRNNYQESIEDIKKKFGAQRK